MAVGDAHRADVVALDEQQLERHAAIPLQPRRLGRDRHAVLGRAWCRRGAGGRRRTTSTMHSRQAPSGDQAFQLAQGREWTCRPPRPPRGWSVPLRRAPVRRRCAAEILFGMALSPDPHSCLAGLVAVADVAAQAAAGLLHRLYGRKADDRLVERLRRGVPRSISRTWWRGLSLGSSAASWA